MRGATLASLVSLAAIGLAAAGDTQPIEQIRDLDLKFAYYYNNNNFDAIQALYHDDAVLIPPTADAFIPSSELSGFFEEMAGEGLTDLTLTPINVVTDGPDTLLEIGNVTHSFQPDGGLYFVKWVNDPERGWVVKVDIMAIGVEWPEASSASSTANNRRLLKQNTTKIIQERDDEFSDDYNNANYDAVSDLYTNNCNLLPIGDTDFVPKEGISEFFAESAKMGLTDITLTATMTLDQDSSTIYEIGQVDTSLGTR